MANMEIRTASIGSWDVDVVKFASDTRHLAIPVMGHIANSIPTSATGKQRLVEWKENVAAAAKSRRGSQPWDPRHQFAISIGFAFCLRAHGNQDLDVENFIKPTIDALAAGLFCTNDQEISSIERFNYDDSNFRHLYIHRLQDASSPTEEGVGINVSVKA